MHLCPLCPFMLSVAVSCFLPFISREINACRCLLGWIAHMSTCYWFCPVHVGWLEASDGCVRKGAHLLILDKRMEEVETQRLLKPFPKSDQKLMHRSCPGTCNCAQYDFTAMLLLYPAFPSQQDLINIHQDSPIWIQLDDDPDTVVDESRRFDACVLTCDPEAVWWM